MATVKNNTYAVRSVYSSFLVATLVPDRCPLFAIGRCAGDLSFPSRLPAPSLDTGSSFLAPLAGLFRFSFPLAGFLLAGFLCYAQNDVSTTFLPCTAFRFTRVRKPNLREYPIKFNHSISPRGK